MQTEEYRDDEDDQDDEKSHLRAREFNAKIIQSLAARLNAKRIVDPGANLTPEEKAEAYDEVRELLGEDISEKTDPEVFRDKRTAEERAEDEKLWLWSLSTDPDPNA